MVLTTGIFQVKVTHVSSNKRSWTVAYKK